MSTTTKEFMPNTTMEIATGSENANGAPGSRRTDAVGAEIPVVINASRYSAATKGASKQLPAVHEETRTVIVFPQGAVVRLSASLTVGELVVLTNRQTGADALCRVVNVKAQPGIQNYVNLEFTQRTPGFWGECIPTDRSEGSPSGAQAPTAAAPMGGSASFPQSASLSQAAAEPPATTMGFRPPSASDSQMSSLQAPSQRPARLAPAVSPIESSVGMPQLNAGRSLMQPGGAEEAPSATKKVMLIAVAAVVLLGIGAAGGMFLLHQGRSTASGNQAANAQSVAAQPPVASPAESSAAPSSVAPAAATPSVNVAPAAPAAQPAEPKSANESPKAAPAPQPASQQASRRSNVEVGKIAAPIVKAPAKAASSDALPVLTAQANGLVSNSLNAGPLLNSASNNSLAAPPPAVRAQGGQIQPPKLVSSTSAVYPAQARAAHIQGDVVVDALVDPTGNVSTVQVISGPAILQQAAMDAVRTWKYQPARLNGKPIEIHTRVSLSFHLQ